MLPPIPVEEVAKIITQYEDVVCQMWRKQTSDYITITLLRNAIMALLSEKIDMNEQLAAAVTREKLLADTLEVFRAALVKINELINQRQGYYDFAEFVTSLQEVLEGLQLEDEEPDPRD